MNEDLMLERKLDTLRERHRELDRQISQLMAHQPDPLTLVRLKKQKLSLRDEIMHLEKIVYPDIIA